jgi:undecaprenyl-diphosphatase
MSRVRVPSIAPFSVNMSLIQALILGIVQGITEFFPVSSSAHLRLFKKIMDIPDGEHLLYFDLLCHAGTLLALLIYLRKDVFKILASFRQIGIFFIALIPLVPAYFLLKPVRIFFSEPRFLGFFLLVTSFLLFSASFPFKHKKPKLFHAFFIGIAQSLALIPGISRSGSTIAVARFCGWTLKEGAKFSFLLAIPTILGGEFLETMKLFNGSGESSVPWICYLTGFLASFGCGLFSCRIVFWIYEQGLIRPFAWYCLIVGIITIPWLRS